MSSNLTNRPSDMVQN
jgi:hypothetical protein